MNARSTATVVVAIVAVISVGVISFLVAGGTDGLPPPERAEPESAGDATAPIGDGDGSLVEVSVEAGDLTLEFLLPEGWVDSAPGSGVGGAQIFPDDPDLARVFDSNVQVATEQGAILFALDTALTHDSQARVFYNPPVPSVDFDAAVDGGRQILLDAESVTITADEPVVLGNSVTGHLFRYRAAVAAGVQENIQVVVPTPQGNFVLLAQSRDASVIDEIQNLSASIEFS